MSGKAILMVRSVISDAALREKFDHWYSTEHLPTAISEFGAEKGSRAWSETDPSVHYAFYHFATMDKLKAAVDSEALKGLIAEYDRTWPQGITRTRELLTLAEEVLG
jgi:hypothetical protein